MVNVVMDLADEEAVDGGGEEDDAMDFVDDEWHIKHPPQKCKNFGRSGCVG